MKALASNIALAAATRRTVAVADCVHFCGYRYGRDETNPYEQYCKDLALGTQLDVIRARFVNFIRFYRPRSVGEALGLNLSQTYPLWYLPWRTPDQVRRSPGWVAKASFVPDLMTHFSEEGLPNHLIAKEFEWHEKAFASIASAGYQPQNHSYVLARELKGERSAYLLTDGNHRISAISALGGKSVLLKLPLNTTVFREKVDRWPLVKAGLMTRQDALAIFDAYLSGNASPARSDWPANIVD